MKCCGRGWRLTGLYSSLLKLSPGTILRTGVNIVKYAVIYEKTKASNPYTFLLKASLGTTLHTAVNVVHHAELIVS